MSSAADSEHPGRESGRLTQEHQAGRVTGALVDLTRTDVRVCGPGGGMTERFRAALSIISDLGDVLLTVQRDDGEELVGALRCHDATFRLHACAGIYHLTDDTVMGAQSARGRLRDLDVDLALRLDAARARGIQRTAEAAAAAMIRDEFGPVRGLPILMARESGLAGLTRVAVADRRGRIDVRVFDASDELFASRNDGDGGWRRPTPELRARWAGEALAAIDDADAERAERVLHRFVQVARSSVDRLTDDRRRRVG